MNRTKLVQTLIRTGKLFKLTIKELSDATGYDLNTVSKWHLKEPIITLYQFIDWAETLGYKVQLRRKNDTTSSNRT